MVIVSAGIGLAMSAATSASMRDLPPAMAGVGSAVNDTTRNIGPGPGSGDDRGLSRWPRREYYTI